MTYYRVKYFSILDTIIMNLKQRFSKESMDMANSVDGFLMFDYSKSFIFINHYKVNELIIFNEILIINSYNFFIIIYLEFIEY